MGSTTINFDDDKELKSAFEEAATQPDADYETWFLLQVEAGLQQAEAGRVIPGEEVERYFAARRAETLSKIDGRR